MMAEASPGFSQVLSAMVQIYEQDKKTDGQPRRPSREDFDMRRIADRVMKVYDTLPEELKREYPKNVVENAYRHLTEITKTPAKFHS